MSSQEVAGALYRELPGSLTIHPQRIDLLSDQVMLVRLTQDDLRTASFLDQRVLRRDTAAAWFTWTDLARRMADEPRGTPAHYIFHIGHCGSTLVSRLLQELGVVPLREPLPLRTLAEVYAEIDSPFCRWSRPIFEARLALTSHFFDRGSGLRAVKATSFCNDLAAPILATHSLRHASIVYSRLRPYLANVLAGPNSRLDLASGAPLRMRRLAARVGGHVGRLCELSPGEVAGMSWAAETAALAAVADADRPQRLLRLDFDRFLADVRGELRRIADHVAPGITDAAIDSAATSPTLTQYSKAPEHAYDAALRQEVLAEGERLFGEEIRRGVTWCERAGRTFPAIARALDMFNET